MNRFSIFYAKFSDDEILDRASGLAFQILTSFIPIIALSYYFFAFFNGFSFLENGIEKYAFQYLAPGTGHQVVDYLHSVQTRVSPKALGIFGVLAFLYSGFAMIYKAETTLNFMWGVVNARPWRERLSRYAIIMVVAPLILGLSIAMTSFLAGSLGHGNLISDLLVFALTGLPYLFSSLLFSLIYVYLPHTPVSRKAALQAGFLTGLSFEILKQGFAYYASYALHNSVYGSLAALPVMLIWVSLMAIVFLTGGEICYFLDQKSAGVYSYATPASKLSAVLLKDILNALEKTPDRSIKNIVKEFNWDQSEITRHMHFLTSNGIVSEKHAQGARDASGQTADESFYSNAMDVREALVRVATELNKVKYEHLFVQKPVDTKSSLRMGHQPVPNDLKTTPTVSADADPIEKSEVVR